MATVADRLRYLMQERGLRQVDILEKAKPYCTEFGLKLTKNDLSQYVNGKVSPGQWKLSILGRALNVSEAWLMGFDVPMERTQPRTPRQDDATEREELVRLFSGLSDEDQKKVLDYVRLLVIAQQANDAHKSNTRRIGGERNDGNC